MSKSFKNIVGHAQQLSLLQNDLETDNLAHAYLFVGPADLGKFTVATSFAKAIQTHKLDEDKAFQVGKLIDRNIHSDTISYRFRPDVDSSIKISDVKSLLNNLQMTGDSWKRILVMEEIDRMTPEAANAMLKMLEEPPRKVVFICTSSNPKMLLDTILSRVRRVDFKMMEQEDLFHNLKIRYRLAPVEKLEQVAKLSFGRIAKAIKLMETDEFFEHYDNFNQQIEDFLREGDLVKAFAFIEQIHKDPVLVTVFLETAAMILHQRLRASTKESVAGLAEALARTDKLLEMIKYADTNVNKRLLLENFILNI